MSGGLLLATTIAFRGATLVDGTGASPVPGSLLVVADGRIVSVGPASSRRDPRSPGRNRDRRLRGPVDSARPDRRSRARGVRRGPEDDAGLGRHVRAPHGGGRGGCCAARPRLGRSRRHPRGVPGGPDLHDPGRLVGPGPSGRREPGPFSRHRRGGALLGPRRESAGDRRDQADARRHGLVPRAEGLSGEGRPGGRRGADRARPESGACGPSSTPRTWRTRRPRSQRAPRVSRTACSTRSTTRPWP